MADKCPLGVETKEAGTAMPDSIKSDQQSSGGGLKELKQYGIPAGLIVAVVMIVQSLGIPYGREAAQRDTEQALRFERLEAEVRATRNDVGQLRAEIRSNTEAAITKAQFDVWVYRLRAENRNSDIVIPNMQ